MRQLTLEAIEQPVTIQTALTLWHLSQENIARYPGLVRHWIQTHVHFALENPERLHRPDWYLDRAAAGLPNYGDCDDLSMLAAALLAVLSIPVRFAAVKLHGTPDYIHVFTEAFYLDRWHRLDATADQIPPGDWDVWRLDVA